MCIRTVHEPSRLTDWIIIIWKKIIAIIDATFWSPGAVAEVKVLNPVQAWVFSCFLFATEKIASITAMIFFRITLHPAVIINDFHVFITPSSSFHGFNTNQFNDLLPVVLLAQLVRALHPYHRGQGFESRKSLNVFRLSVGNSKSCVYNCDDLPSHNSSPHSSHIWFSYINITSSDWISLKNVSTCPLSGSFRLSF